MAKHRHRLPQLDGELMITDGGLETDLIFHHGFDLPHFAAFDLLRSDEGTAALRELLRRVRGDRPRARRGARAREPHLARQPRLGARCSATATRSSTRLNRGAIELLQSVREDFERAGPGIVVSGCIGPRGDGYVAGAMMSPNEAQAYHAAPDPACSRDAGADMVVRDHHDLRRRGHRRDPRRPRGRHPRRDLVHRRDRRQAAQRAAPRRGHRRGRRRDRRRARLLHDQLRPPHPLRGRPRGGRGMGDAGSGVCGPTRRARATRSSTRRRSSTRATRPSSARSTGRSAAGCPRSACWAAAAAPTTGTSPRSPRPGWRQRSDRIVPFRRRGGTGRSGAQAGAAGDEPPRPGDHRRRQRDGDADRDPQRDLRRAEHAVAGRGDHVEDRVGVGQRAPGLAEQRRPSRTRRPGRPAAG